jgi:phage-related holin
MSSNFRYFANLWIINYLAGIVISVKNSGLKFRSYMAVIKSVDILCIVP